MTKKKIVSLCLAAVLVVMAIAGATVAYFTDTDAKTNTFTVGNVKIELIEQQRKVVNGEKTTDLKDFEQSKKLYPIVGSVQGAENLDGIGMPTAKNYVDKMITVKNTGSEKAYIRAYFAIPAALDNKDGSAAGNVLHFNDGNRYVKDEKNDGWYSTKDYEWLWGKNSFDATIKGIKYNVYYADFYQAVAAGETTFRFVDGVYLDKSFDMKHDGAYAFGQKLTLDQGWDWNNVSCPVFAVACQAEGFDSASEAITAAFGANYNPWAE